MSDAGKDKRLAVPLQDPVMRQDGNLLSQGWTEYHQRIVDRLFNIPIEAKIGVTDGSEAQPGQIGEVLTSFVPAVSLTTGTPLTITSLDLPPGDWDVTGHVFFTLDPSCDPASFATAISDGDDFIGGTPSLTESPNFTVGGHAGQWAGPRRFLTTDGTTAYLVAQSAFTGGGMLADGTITARRMR